LIGVVLNDYTWFDDAATLLDWGFENYSALTAVQSGETLATLSVEGGTEKKMEVVAAQSLSCATRPGENYEVQLSLPDNLTAPLSAGQIVGSATLMVEGAPMATVDLVCAAGMEEGGFLSRLSRVLSSWHIFSQFR